MKGITNFLKGVRGKQILVSALAIMIIASGYVRWMNKTEEVAPVVNEELPENVQAEQEPSGEIDTEYFARARYERDCARSEAVELLTVSSVSADENVIAERVELYAKNAENEATIESLVKSKGYEDCVAFVDDEGVRVVVKADELESTGVAQIKDIVVEQTGLSPTKIKISSKN